MLRNSEGETEILLGNKQLLGIFFVAVVLLGLGVAGGYKIGFAAAHKETAAAPVATADETTTTAGAARGGETHALPADANSAGPAATDAGSSNTPPVPPTREPASAAEADVPLGSRAVSNSAQKGAAFAQDSEAAGPSQPPPKPSRVATPATSGPGGFTPQGGQTFLQVAAVSRDEAEGIADVLRKKNFRAHAVPKPGSAKLYRVIIGPIRDATDLNSTRASLRSTGFREIFVQRY